VVTNVSEEPVASIFRVEVSEVAVQVDYIRRMASREEETPKRGKFQRRPL
jgi:hypothetical protein